MNIANIVSKCFNNPILSYHFESPFDAIFNCIMQFETKYNIRRVKIGIQTLYTKVVNPLPLNHLHVLRMFLQKKLHYFIFSDKILWYY